MPKQLKDMTLSEIVNHELDYEAIEWIATGLAEGRDDCVSVGDPGYEEATAIINDLKQVAARLKAFYGISD